MKVGSIIEPIPPLLNVFTFPTWPQQCFDIEYGPSLLICFSVPLLYEKDIEVTGSNLSVVLFDVSR